MIKVGGSEIESQWIEYGVQHAGEDEVIGLGWDGEEEARFEVAMDEGSKLLARHVYETAWAEVAA